MVYDKFCSVNEFLLIGLTYGVEEIIFWMMYTFFFDLLFLCMYFFSEVVNPNPIAAGL